MHLVKRYHKEMVRRRGKNVRVIRRYDVALRCHDGRIRKFPGAAEKHVALEIGRRIEALVQAKLMGTPPPTTLDVWIANMPQKLAARLTRLRLLEPIWRDRNKPIDELIDEFHAAVLARLSNKKSYADDTRNTVRRIINGVGVAKFSDLTEERINKWLRCQIIKSGENEGLPLSPRSRREFIVKLKTFGNYLIDTNRVAVNHLAKMRGPSAREETRRKRRPLSIREIHALIGYLDLLIKTGASYGAWGPLDRKMCYWTMMKTGFRHSETRSLRCCDANLSNVPATVCVLAAFSKTKTLGRIPIPSDLAHGLREYIASRSSDGPLFPMPSPDSMRKAFYADLEAAGIPRKNEKGEYVDIHSLRHTHVTLLLTVDRLSTKDVQFMARLKSIRLVDTYSMYYEPDQFPHLEKSPTLLPPSCDSAPDLPSSATVPNNEAAVKPEENVKRGLTNGAKSIDEQSTKGEQGPQSEAPRTDLPVADPMRMFDLDRNDFRGSDEAA